MTYKLVSANGSVRGTFTLDRDAATSRDGLEFLGLDHPLVQEEWARWRDLAPEELKISVLGSTEPTVLVSLWLIETSSVGG